MTDYERLAAAEGLIPTPWSALDDLAAWCEKNSHEMSFTLVDGDWWIDIAGVMTAFYGASIEKAARNAITRLREDDDA